MKRRDAAQLILAGVLLLAACASYPPPRWVHSPPPSLPPWRIPDVSYLPQPIEVLPPLPPVIILAYPGADGTDPFRPFAEAFADMFRCDAYHVVTVPCDVHTPRARRESVNCITHICAALNPEPVTVIAWSAAAWPTEVATLEGSHVSRLVIIGGVHDFTDRSLPPLVRPYYHAAQADADLSPMRRDLSRLPPTLLLHSASDTFVPPAHARRFYERAKAAGRRVTLRYLSTPEHAPGKPAARRAYHGAAALWLHHGA